MGSPAGWLCKLINTFEACRFFKIIPRTVFFCLFGRIIAESYQALTCWGVGVSFNALKIFWRKQSLFSQTVALFTTKGRTRDLEASTLSSAFHLISSVLCEPRRVTSPLWLQFMKGIFLWETIAYLQISDFVRANSLFIPHSDRWRMDEFTCTEKFHILQGVLRNSS